jgi:thiosulfate/3-mercaptopyruvate sulfurtransferase
MREAISQPDSGLTVQPRRRPLPGPFEWDVKRFRRQPGGRGAGAPARATDIFVGWGSLRGKDYHVRQFRDMKIIPKTELLARPAFTGQKEAGAAPLRCTTLFVVVSGFRPPRPRGRAARSRAEVTLTVALPYDSAAKFREYAHPEMIVSTEWVAEHLDDPGLVVAESDEDVLLYETGHVPGAVKLDWHTELNDPVDRDYVDGAGFAGVMSEKGIARDTTLVLYGDRNNWWAAYALWVCSLFGHPDLRLMDGGRAKWIAEGRPVSTQTPRRPRTDYPVVDRDDKQIRAFKDQVLEHLGQPMIDVRSPGEYTGELLHMPDYPQEGALRGGHIPGARNIPWARAAAEDATFRTRAELEGIYRDEAGLRPEDDVVVYCRIGERSSHTWFVLQHLLGYPRVRNYDGSWTEWGNSVRVPISKGDKP